ncbi:MAG: deoxyribonuclease IV [bacterium]|nr:deoxyribonuclease IV [bacterium]
MLFGAHVSIAGGLEKAPLNAAALGCEVFQFFSRSPRGGKAGEITDEIREAFLANCKEHDLKQWVIHTPYYINLASPTARNRRFSGLLIREELERATLLGASYVMFHPGTAKEVGHEKAIEYAAEEIKRVYDGYEGSAELLIEISAGAGEIIGASFEENAAILEAVGNPAFGVCFDTCHAFASGYDLRDAASVKKTFAEFDRVIGLKKLKMSHCNDCKVGLGERRDRHEHLGKGKIGVEGFKAMIAHPKLKHMNFYLETEPEGVKADLKLLKKLRNNSS